MRSVTLLGAPSDINSSYLRGCARGPQEIRAALASPSANSWTETGVDLSVEGRLLDKGDLDLGPDGADFDALERAVRSYVERDERVIVLGGDHAITAPVVRAHDCYREKLTLLHFDAHADLYDDFEGNPNSHASPFARIMEQDGVKRLVQVGIRTLTAHLREQCARFDVEVIEMRDWDRVHELKLDSPVYVSLDLDVLDPAHAPGVSHWEPGGATTRQVMDVIQSLRCEVVGADVVELNPERDPSGMTAMVGARLVRELCGAMLGD